MTTPHEQKGTTARTLPSTLPSSAHPGHRPAAHTNLSRTAAHTARTDRRPPAQHPPLLTTKRMPI
jgi:hypothetical protein